MIFNIYDKNRNGVLDETDLMQMINLSNKIPTIQLDIVKISKAMLNEEHTQTNSQPKEFIKSKPFKCNSCIDGNNSMRSKTTPIE